MLKRSLFFLVVIVLLATVGYYGWGRLRDTVKVDPPQLVTVKRGQFVHEILDRGSIDSARNTDIPCMVESQAAGTNITIVYVVPEGTIVEEGDLLVELDSPTLHENLQTQETNVISAEATLAQAQAGLRTSNIQLREYLEGVYEQERTVIENRIFSADEQVRTLENDLVHSQRLLERGYTTQAQVEAALIERDKAKNTLKMEKINLNVLETLTRERRITQLEAAIASDAAAVAAAERTLQNRQNRFKYLQEQLERCKIYAPRSGQVVYFMPRWGNEDQLIREGLRVNERQVLLQLPDPTQMQVRALVNEANVRLVRPGQKATIRLEAFPNQVFEGIVRAVNDFPEPTSWHGTSMSREYLTTVTVLNPPEGIRVGLTAEVRIVVNEISNVLLLPIQAVFEYGKKMYAVTFNEGRWDKVEVVTGSANDREVVILEGLNEGDTVVLGAWAHRDKINLPVLEQEPRRDAEDIDEEMFLEMMRRELEGQQQERPAGGPGGRRPGGGGSPGGNSPGGAPSGGGGGPRM